MSSIVAAASLGNDDHLANAEANRITHIRAARCSLSDDLREVWRFRIMAWLLVWRDFKVKYKQSALGALAIVIQPFFSVILYSFIFGGLARMDSEGRPYAIFNYVGMLPWLLFSTGMNSVASCLVGNTHLIQKVHFPRTLLPFYGILTCLPDFLVLFAIQLGLLLFCGFVPTINVVWLPLFVLWTMLVALSVGFALSALMARYRDMTHAVAFLIQIWFYATPIVYSYKLLQGNLRYVSMLNPMTWVVNAFRWSLLGTDDGPQWFLLVPLTGTFVVLYLSYIYFRRTEQLLADVI